MIDRATRSHASRIVQIAVVLTLFAVSLVAAELPDLELNPVTGNVESVDLDPNGDRVRHLVDRGQGGLRLSLSISSVDSRSPRIAIRPDGDSWVVWWKDAAVDGVYYAVRDLDTGNWTPETRLGDVQKSTRYPEIVHAGSTTWIVTEVEDGDSRSIVVHGISEGPEPIDEMATVADSDCEDDTDPQVHAEAGHVWVSWIDSPSEVGWSAYDSASGTWNAPQFLSYAGTDVAQAREQVRASVLEN